MQDSGIVWGLGSDATAVTTSNPFYTLGFAVTGKMIGGRQVNRQTITREEALIAHTRNNAYIVFQEANLGSIQPGKYADLLVLDRDYLTVPADQIKDIKPVMTMVGGKSSTRRGRDAMDVIMPQLGETVAEGIVTKWYKKVGDAVKADEVLFDVETDKVSTEIPAPTTGVVAEILVEEGVTAKVGARLAVIREGHAAAAVPGTGPLSAAVKADGTGAQRISPTAPHAAEIAKPPHVPPPAGAQDRLSPVVRKLIAEYGLDPQAIHGSGRDGRITREDVTQHVAQRGASMTGAERSRTAPPVTRAPDTPPQSIEPTGPQSIAAAAAQSLPLNSVRKRVAENMTKSWTSVPHVLQVVEADFSTSSRHAVRSVRNGRSASDSVSRIFLSSCARCRSRWAVIRGSTRLLAATRSRRSGGSTSAWRWISTSKD